MKYPGKPLNFGSKGPAVKALQRKLNQRYVRNRKLIEDGDFGPHTATVVDRFLRNRRLGTTAEVDHVIWNRIFGYPPPKLHPRRPETLKDRLRRLRVELPVRQSQVKRGHEKFRPRLNKVKRGIVKTVAALRPKGVTVSGNTVTGGTPRQRLVTAAYAALRNYQRNPGHWFYSQPGAWTARYGITGPPRGYRSDCSQWVTSLYHSCGLPDPNGAGYSGGYTGTLANNGRKVSRAAAEPGDLVIWDPYGRQGHVEILVSDGNTGRTIGHGSAPIREHHVNDFAYKGTPIFVRYV